MSKIDQAHRLLTVIEPLIRASERLHVAWTHAAANDDCLEISERLEDGLEKALLEVSAALEIIVNLPGGNDEY